MPSCPIVVDRFKIPQHFGSSIGKHFRICRSAIVNRSICCWVQQSLDQAFNLQAIGTLVRFRTGSFYAILLRLECSSDILRKSVIDIEPAKSFMAGLAISNMRFTLLKTGRFQQALQKLLQHRWLRTCGIRRGL